MDTDHAEYYDSLISFLLFLTLDCIRFVNLWIVKEAFAMEMLQYSFMQRALVAG